MKKIFVTLILIPFIFFGCGPKTVNTKTEICRLFETDFGGFTVPEIDKIKQGEGKSFPYTEFDEVWDSAIIVLMQQGIVLRSSKDSGIIVAIGSLPLSIFVERGERVHVYINVMEDLYKRLDDPEKIALEFSPDRLDKIYTNFFAKLATQVYAGKKWKYLGLDTNK